MATRVALVTLVLTILVQVYARQIRATDQSTIKTPANLTTEELVYILQSRHGGAAIKPKRLTPCARAILSCCNDKVINENCSESLHCGAFFFDDNPCDDKFITDALKNANAFYEQLGQDNTLRSS